MRVESAETQDSVSEPQWVEEENEEEMEELSFIPSAVSEPRWAWHTCDRVEKKAFNFCQLVGVTMYSRRLKQGER